MEKYNKLVRDNIPDIIKNNGENPIVRTLNDEEYFKLLCVKLLEEVNEYIEDNNIEELADIYEVYTSILKFQNIKLEEVEKVAEKN